MFSPLEQFSINKIISLQVGFLDFSITNSTILVFLAVNLAVVFYNFACNEAKLVPHVSQTIFEHLYDFIFYTVLSENVKKNGSRFVMIFLFSFAIPYFSMFEESPAYCMPEGAGESGGSNSSQVSFSNQGFQVS